MNDIGYEIKWSYDLRSYERNFYNCIEKPEKFIAQLVRASHRNREVTGSNPVEVLNFSGFSNNWLLVPNWETVAVTVQAQMHITCLASDYWSGWPWPLLISVLMGQTSRTNSTNSWRANYWNVRPNILQPWFQICIDSSSNNGDVVVGNVSRQCVAKVILNSLDVSLLPACAT